MLSVWMSTEKFPNITISIIKYSHTIFIVLGMLS